MVYEYFYSTQEIAKILFHGDRTLHLDTNTHAKTKGARPLSQSFAPAVQPGEDKASLKSAEEYLSFLGYDERKIAIFRLYCDEATSLYLSDNKIPEESAKRSPDFYAGVQVLGKSLNNSETAAILEHEFARRFDIMVKDKSILIARKEMRARKPASFFMPA